MTKLGRDRTENIGTQFLQQIHTNDGYDNIPRLLLFSHFVLLDLMILGKSNMPKRCTRCQAGKSGDQLLFFPIPVECRRFLCTQSYQNGSSLEQNAAVQTMNSDVLLTMK